MKIVVFGDSNSYGSEAVKDFDYISEENKKFAFGSIIASRLNAEYENYSRPGSTNTEIISKVFEWCKTNNDKLEESVLLIGWTEAGRFKANAGDREILLAPITLKAYYANLEMPDSFDFLFEELKKIDPTKEFSRIYIEQVNKNEEAFLSYFLGILSLDFYLQKLNARYLSFSTLPFELPTHLKFYKKLLSKQNNIFYGDSIHKRGDIFTSFFDYIEMFKEFKAAGGHLNSNGHIAAAEWLIDELKNRNII